MKASLQRLTFLSLALLALASSPHALAQSGTDAQLASLDVLYSRYQQPLLLSAPRPVVPTVPQTPALDLASSSDLAATDPLNDSSSSSSNIRPILQPPTETKFRWKPAFKEALLYTGIMQAWRFPTEAGTRDALDGPFFKDYFDSILATRGWDDGDTLVTSYIAHPMEGGIFGYIQRQNDPLYRNVEIGDGRRYWLSILRSYAFAAVWSTQWTLGPVSEASLGNVQLHDSPGFVDLIGSPTFGMFWMMGEDILDKYALARLENHTANRALIVLTRSFANPCRTFANLMAFKKPWERPNRPGVFRDAFDLRSEYVRGHRDGTWEGPGYVQQWRDWNHIDTGIDWRPHVGPYSAIPDFEVVAPCTRLFWAVAVASVAAPAAPSPWASTGLWSPTWPAASSSTCHIINPAILFPISSARAGIPALRIVVRLTRKCSSAAAVSAMKSTIPTCTTSS